mmetsp:Transcript_72726/g.210564  ORF Transcript_72726/g.210564 Transcript_72726/m.210564 type:complete len:218 (+) Transcript_72726:3-656(+)
MRFLPSFCARSAWPKELLILWAPVCAISSRLNHNSAPPNFAVKFLAKYNGVGPPTNSTRKRWSSLMNSGSFLVASHATLNSSCASMSVSGMYLPPNLPPKYQALLPSGAESTRAFFAGGAPPLDVGAGIGPPERSLTSVFMASIPPSPPSACTILDPTTTPSAYLLISSTCLRSDTPKPTAMATSLSPIALRTPATTSPTSVFTEVRAPVTPRTLTT